MIQEPFNSVKTSGLSLLAFSSWSCTSEYPQQSQSMQKILQSIFFHVFLERTQIFLKRGGWRLGNRDKYNSVSDFVLLLCSLSLFPSPSLSFSFLKSVLQSLCFHYCCLFVLHIWLHSSMLRSFYTDLSLPIFLAHYCWS